MDSAAGDARPIRCSLTRARSPPKCVCSGDHRDSGRCPPTRLPRRRCPRRPSRDPRSGGPSLWTADELSGDASAEPAARAGTGTSQGRSDRGTRPWTSTTNGGPEHLAQAAATRPRTCDGRPFPPSSSTTTDGPSGARRRRRPRRRARARHQPTGATTRGRPPGAVAPLPARGRGRAAPGRVAQAPLGARHSGRGARLPPAVRPPSPRRPRRRGPSHHDHRRPAAGDLTRTRHRPPPAESWRRAGKRWRPHRSQHGRSFRQASLVVGQERVTTNGDRYASTHRGHAAEPSCDLISNNSAVLAAYR